MGEETKNVVGFWNAQLADISTLFSRSGCEESQESPSGAIHTAGWKNQEIQQGQSAGGSADSTGLRLQPGSSRPGPQYDKFDLFWLFNKQIFVIVYVFFARSQPPAQSDPSSMSAERFRIFRAEKTYCVNAGKWYFELEVSLWNLALDRVLSSWNKDYSEWYLHLFQVITAGEMRVGWARPGCLPDQELGTDDQAFVFDGFKVDDFDIV